MTRKDFFYLIIFGLFFFFLGVFRLGDFNEFPVTGIEVTIDNPLIIEIKDSMKEKFSEYYIGIYSAEIYGESKIEYSKDGQNYISKDLEYVKLLSNYYVLLFKDEYLDYSYIKLSSTENWKINELLFFKDDYIFEPNSDFIINNKNVNSLFDETRFLVRDNNVYRINILDSSKYTGFDEMIYKLAPYEIINKTQSFEITHPPLGKAIITIGTILFGYNFFGVRIMSLLFSIMLLILIYLFAKKITRNSNFALLSMIVFGFDTMRHVMSRLCTIGNFDIFFIVLMFYLMYDFVTSEKLVFDIKDSLRLFFCGIALGLAISCKWTGFYGALGLAVLFFIGLYRRFISIKKELNKLELLKNTENFNEEIINKIEILKTEYSLNKLLNITCPCFVYFVLIPITIYIFSYVFFTDYSNNVLIIRMINNQFEILKHHTIEATIEVGTSNPYLWPIGGGLMKSLSIFNVKEKTSNIVIFLGNPAIILLSIPMIMISIYNSIKKDIVSLYLFIAGLSLYIPWLMVNRPLYVYHYFLFIPFLILMIVYNLYKLYLRNKKIGRLMIVVLILLLLFFYVIMIPIINGFTVNEKYFNFIEKLIFFNNLK